MPETVPPGISRAAALAQLGGWLTGTLGAIQIDGGKLPDRFRAGWGLTTVIEGAPTRLRLLIDPRFPWSKPRVALVDPPPFPSYPHVEEDGLICVLAEVDEADPRNPLGTAKAVLAGAVNVLEKGLTGANVEDFRSEFQSYWAPSTKGAICSIVDPCEPSCTIKVWDGKKLLLAAENDADLRNWLANRFDKKSVADISIARVLTRKQPFRYPPVSDAASQLAPDSNQAAASFGAVEP
jgi:hypothetical protein